MTALLPTDVTVDAARADVPVTSWARLSALAAVMALVATAVVSVIAGSGSPTVRPGVLASGDLAAELDGTWVAVAVGDTIPSSVRLRTVSGAVVGLGGGRVELVAGSSGRRVDDQLDLAAGTALVEDEVFVAVRAGLVQAEGRGVWRVDAGAAARIASYDGVVTIEDAGGRELDLERGWQVALNGDRVDTDVVPLRYLATDELDQELLPDAIAVDTFLDATSRGIAADYGTSPQAAAFYQDFDTLDGAVVDALRPLGFQAVGARFGPPAEVLVAAVVSEALVRGAGLAPVEAASAVDDARRAGAQYGLVTHLRDVSATTVREAAAAALTRRRALVATGAAAPVVGAPSNRTPVAPVVALPSSTPSPSPSPEEPTPSASTSAPAPPPPPRPQPTPEPSPTAGESPAGPTGGVVDEVEDVVGPLDDVVGEDGAEVVEDVTELVDDLLGGVEVPGDLLDDLPLLPTDEETSELPVVGDLLDELPLLPAPEDASDLPVVGDLLDDLVPGQR